MVLAPQRLALLDNWRRMKRYRLNSEEKEHLVAMRSRTNLYQTISYGFIGATWWATGKPNKPEVYNQMKFLTPDMVSTLTSVQRFKLGFPVLLRGMLALASIAPFSYLTSQVESRYFDSVAKQTTLYGSFARYLQQQGENMENGRVIEPYFHGNSYLKEKAQVTKVLVEPKSETLELTQAEQQKASSERLYRGGGLMQTLARDQEAKRAGEERERTEQSAMDARVVADAQRLMRSIPREEPITPSIRSPTNLPYAEPEAAVQRLRPPQDDTEAFMRTVFGN